MYNSVCKYAVSRLALIAFLPVLTMFLVAPKLPNLSRFKKTHHPPRAILAEKPAQGTAQQAQAAPCPQPCLPGQVGSLPAPPQAELPYVCSTAPTVPPPPPFRSPSSRGPPPFFSCV